MCLLLWSFCSIYCELGSLRLVGLVDGGLRVMCVWLVHAWCRTLGKIIGMGREEEAGFASGSLVVVHNTWNVRMSGFVLRRT